MQALHDNRGYRISAGLADYVRERTPRDLSNKLTNLSTRLKPVTSKGPRDKVSGKWPLTTNC